jgi:methionyl aminopeptidase
VIQPGDVLNVDVSAELGGFFADTGGTTIVPLGKPKNIRLCNAARTALDEAIKRARAGKPIAGLGAAMQRTAKKYNFRITENLASHGIGRALHEEPESIRGYFDPTDRRVLSDGLVITIETRGEPILVTLH